MSDFTTEEIAQYLRRYVMTEIDALEKSQARAIREQTIGRGGTPAELKKRLEDIDDKIAALRANLR